MASLFPSTPTLDVQSKSFVEEPGAHPEIRLLDLVECLLQVEKLALRCGFQDAHGANHPQIPLRTGAGI
jgi:hypothetical protein